MRYSLIGLDCPNCAAKLERELRKVKGLEKIEINFNTLSVELPEKKEAEARMAIARVEPGVELQRSDPRRIVACGQDKGAREKLWLMMISGGLFLGGIVFNEQLHRTPFSWAEYAVLLTAYLLVGWPVVSRAAKKLIRGQLFDENFLMTIATAGAIGIHQLPEATGVMLFYAVGEFFQERAVNFSRRSIVALLNIQPEFANIKVDNGAIKTDGGAIEDNGGAITNNGGIRRVKPETVRPGAIILIKPGEKVPLDGEIIEGSSFVNTVALTGESLPRKVEPGEKVLAGMINGQGLLTVKVLKPFQDSSVARILHLVEQAGERKAPAEQFITRFAHYYTPVIVGLAALLAVFPPLILPGASSDLWFYRALVLLVISCPCALMVSIPLGYFGGVGRASKNGILVKGANYLDALANLDTVVFDKTGTLTRGVFRVTEIFPKNNFTSEELLAAAAAAEAFSNHPIAQSIRQAYLDTTNMPVPVEEVRDYEEIPGRGIRAVVNGRRVLAGCDALMHQENIAHEDCDPKGASIYIAIDGVYAGYILIADEIKADARETIEGLKRLGIRKTVILTGDDQSIAAKVGRELGVDEYYAELLPEDKVRKLEELEWELGSRRQQKLAFIGDGINDAPVIARADIGVAMGGLGSDAAIEAADVVLMEDFPSKLLVAVELARRTRRIVRQNIFLALTVKGFFILLGSAGMASIWEAVFADVGVTLLAVFNATRTLSGGKKIVKPARF